MLLAGTTRGLWDLERSFSIAEYTAVTALTARAGTAWVLLDQERIELVGAYEVAPVALLSRADGQCLGSLPNRQLIVGREGAHLAVTRPAPGSGLDPLEGFDAVPERDQWKNPAGPSPDLRSVAVDDNGRCYVNVHVGGLWTADNLAGPWEQSVEAEADIHQVALGNLSTVAVAAAQGVGWSEDGGRSWRWTTDGLDASYCRAIALDGSRVYVTASTGPSTARAAIYRAEHLGDPFVKCTRGLPEWFASNIDTGCVTARHGRVAFGTRHGEVFQSRDGAESFEVLASELGPVTSTLYV